MVEYHLMLLIGVKCPVRGRAVWIELVSGLVPGQVLGADVLHLEAKHPESVDHILHGFVQFGLVVMGFQTVNYITMAFKQITPKLVRQWGATIVLRHSSKKNAAD